MDANSHGVEIQIRFPDGKIMAGVLHGDRVVMIDGSVFSLDDTVQGIPARDLEARRINLEVER